MTDQREHAGWERVYEWGTDSVERMRVPGGWLYRNFMREEFKGCFVPDPATLREEIDQEAALLGSQSDPVRDGHEKALKEIFDLISKSVIKIVDNPEDCWRTPITRMANLLEEIRVIARDALRTAKL